MERRIKYLNELRREVELKKARNKPKKQIDWQAIAADYMEWFAENPI